MKIKDITGEEMGALLSSIHTHVGLLAKFEATDEEVAKVMINPAEIVYKEEGVARLLKAIGLPEPIWGDANPTVLDKEADKVMFVKRAAEFFENFIQNCKNSPRLDSIQTAYFGHWAMSIIGEEPASLPAEKQIGYIHIQAEKPDGDDK